MACHADQSAKLIKGVDEEIYKILNYLNFQK